MNRVISYLVRRDLRFEIKRPETAFATPLAVEFRIQIKDAIRGSVDDSEIGVTGALDAPFSGAGEIAFESGGGIELSTQQVFKVTACFIDPPDSLHWIVGLIHLTKHAVQDIADSFDDALIGEAGRI